MAYRMQLHTQSAFQIKCLPVRINSLLSRNLVATPSLLYSKFLKAVFKTHFIYSANYYMEHAKYYTFNESA